jgi:cytochrome c2
MTPPSRLPLTRLITVLAVLFIIVFSAAALSVLRAIPVPERAATSTAAVGTAVAGMTTTASGATSIPPTAPPFAADVEARVKEADPSQGEALFQKYSCDACHGHENSTGPYVVGLGTRAATRRPGYSAAAYIYESIANPTAFTVPEFPAGVMPQNFKQIIPEDALFNLIAWLLTK